MEIVKKIIVWISIVRFCPHIVIYFLSKNKRLINADICSYAKEYNIQSGSIYRLIYLLFYNKSFRALFYFRIGALKYFCQWLAQSYNSLIISKDCKVGGGLLLFHSYGTILNANSIGENCRIVHLVTLGDKHGKRPTIGNGVEILPNAVITGDVTIGDGCVIGPGAVVFKSVPANCVVVGNPAYILKQDGVVVRRPL